MVRSSTLAIMKGSRKYPNIIGTVSFRPHMNGSWVSANIAGLPNGFLGFHLHEKGDCSKEDDFESAGKHYNPTDAEHPNHAGDFPVLLSNDGIAQSEFYTDRITPQEAVEKTVIVHSSPDDFRTDPAGRAGDRIACGVVKNTIDLSANRTNIN